MVLNHNPYVAQLAVMQLSPNEAERFALEEFIHQVGHEHIDVPICCDGKGEAAFSRFTLGYFLRKLLAKEASRNGEKD